MYNAEMPELPEVHTTVTGLQKFLPKLKITDVWTDLSVGKHKTPHLSTSHKDKNFFSKMKKEIVGVKILSAKRRAKNILINLENGQTILVHLKMTGHMMIGKYAFDSRQKIWAPDKTEKNEALRDPYNRFIHVVFSLSNGKHLVLSDVRKFAKVTLIPTSSLEHSIHLKHLGPEPLEKNFTEKKFWEQIMKRPKRPIKIVLLEQKLIAGIGNIYSDEMLWLAGVHPFSIVEKIPKKQISLLYKNMKLVLQKGIDFGGDSTSDYRDVTGKRGNFQNAHNVYRRLGKACPKKGCKGKIAKLPFGGRSAHFCPIHQKLYK